MPQGHRKWRARCIKKPFRSKPAIRCRERNTQLPPTQLQSVCGPGPDQGQGPGHALNSVGAAFIRLCIIRVFNS